MNQSLQIIKSQNSTYLCYQSHDKFVDILNPMHFFSIRADTYHIIPQNSSLPQKVYTYQGFAVRLLPILSPKGLSLCLQYLSDETAIIPLTLDLVDSNILFGLSAFLCINHVSHPHAMLFLLTHGIVTSTGYSRRIGLVNHPVVMANLPLIYQHRPTAFINYLKEAQTPFLEPP